MGQLVAHMFKRGTIDVEPSHDGIPMTCRKILETTVDHFQCQLLVGRMPIGIGQLDVQTLLQRTRTDAARFKLLQHMEQTFEFVACGDDVMIDGELIDQGIQILTQETILVE